MMVLVGVVMIVFVVIIVLVVVVDGGGGGCDSFSGCVLFSFIFYTFSKVQFIFSNVVIWQSTKKKQTNKKKNNPTQTRLISSVSTPCTNYRFMKRQCGASHVPILLAIL